VSSRPPPLSFGATSDWIDLGFDGVSPYHLGLGLTLPEICTPTELV